MPATLPSYFCPLLSASAAQTRKEFAGQGDFLFNQSLWGVFAQKDLVQALAGWWLGRWTGLCCVGWMCHQVLPSPWAVSSHGRTWFCCHQVHQLAVNLLCLFIRTKRAKTRQCVRVKLLGVASSFSRKRWRYCTHSSPSRSPWSNTISSEKRLPIQWAILEISEQLSVLIKLALQQEFELADYQQSLRAMFPSPHSAQTSQVWIDLARFFAAFQWLFIPEELFLIYITL